MPLVALMTASEIADHAQSVSVVNINFAPRPAAIKRIPFLEAATINAKRFKGSLDALETID
jgi:hypothetical protein